MLPVFSYFVLQTLVRSPLSSEIHLCILRSILGWYSIFENNSFQRSTLDRYRRVSFRFDFGWSFLFSRF